MVSLYLAAIGLAVGLALDALIVRLAVSPYDGEDDDCDLDYVPNEARPHQVDVVLSNSFGLGGQNASLVLRRYRE